jgi:hypothetical protein
MDCLIAGKKMTADIRFDARAHNMVSSKWLCALAASVVVLAPATVQAGVTISAAATKNMVCTSGVCSPNHKDAVLNITDLQDLLATSNVKVTTGTGALAAETSDIDVNSTVTWTSTLTLAAYHSRSVRPFPSAERGDLSFVTDDGGTGGALSFDTAGGASCPSVSSSLAINGTAYTLVGDLATLASDIASNPSGTYALANNYDVSVDGTYTSAPIATEFEGSGTLQGLGNTISNLTIRANKYSGAIGLFLDAGTAVIAYLQLAKVNISGGTQEGGLAGASNGLLLGDLRER